MRKIARRFRLNDTQVLYLVSFAALGAVAGWDQGGEAAATGAGIMAGFVLLCAFAGSFLE